MKSIYLSFIFIFVSFLSFSQEVNLLRTGRWLGILELIDAKKLHFEMLVEAENSTFSIKIKNGEEIVLLETSQMIEDSFSVHFSHFDTELIFKIHSDTLISGRWINHLKTNYSLPFFAKPSDEQLFNKKSNDEIVNFSGKWKTLFSPDNRSFDAIGIFEQKDNYITGTFMTETGDYRFLSGNVVGNELYMTGFDGSHAFLFEGILNNEGKIDGVFISGNHYKTNWIAEKNDTFQLRNPDSLVTFVGSPDNFSFSFPDLEGSIFTYPNKKFVNKVIIIQIMGTWCSNCIDETHFLKKLHQTYHKEGLELISIAYELGDDVEMYKQRLKKYKERFDINHLILIGGSAQKSKAKAREDFNFLSDFTSFPTTLFLDKQGQVVRVHTGFAGPGTGEVYQRYVEETTHLIEKLLNH